MQFIFALVEEDLLGIFENLQEGDRVARFGNVDLYISYAAGSGNDVALFSRSVPEPGGCWLLMLLSTATLRRRRVGRSQSTSSR